MAEMPGWGEDMAEDMPGDMAGEMPGEMPGDMPGEMPGEMPGKMPGDMAAAPLPVLSPQGDPKKRRSRHKIGPILCDVIGCGAEIERKYLKRFRLCQEHHRSLALVSGDQLVRFCQQCNKLHDVREFTGDHRNCDIALRKRQRKGNKATDNKVRSKSRLEPIHCSDQDSSTVGSDCDGLTSPKRSRPCRADNTPAPRVVSVCKDDGDRPSSMGRPGARDGRDIDSANNDPGKAGCGGGKSSPNSVTLDHWWSVTEVRKPVFMRSDSISSYEVGSVDVQMKHLLSDEEISDQDLPLHLCTCGVCSICRSAREIALDGSSCWTPYECGTACAPTQAPPPVQPVAEEPTVPCAMQGQVEPSMWSTPSTPDFGDGTSDYWQVPKAALHGMESSAACAAPLELDADPFCPIAVDANEFQQGRLAQWPGVIPAVGRDTLSPYPRQQCQSTAQSRLATQAVLYRRAPANSLATAGPNLHFAAPRAGNAQYGRLHGDSRCVPTGPPTGYMPGPVDAVSPKFNCAQRKVYPPPLAIEEQLIAQGNEISPALQRASVSPHHHMQVMQPTQPTQPAGLLDNPLALALAASRQGPQQRPQNLVQFRRRTLKMPEAVHDPQMDLLEALGPVAAGGHLAAQTRAMSGCVRVVVTVATEDDGLSGSTRFQAVATAEPRHAALPDVNEASSHSCSDTLPHFEEVPEGQAQQETTVLEQVASQLPSAVAQRLPTDNCWIQTEHHLGRVVDGNFREQWDVAEPLRGFDVLSILPATFLASQDTDVKILGRGLGQPARVLCSFGSETRVLSLSLTRIRVGWAGEVEIIESRNSGQSAGVDASEALALVARARGGVEVGDVLEVWSGRVRAFHGEGVGYVEAEMGHLLTNPMPIMLTSSMSVLEDMEVLEKEVEECRMTEEELRQTREDIGQVISHLAHGNHVAAAKREEDRIDFDVRPWNDQGTPEFRAMMVTLANWHVGNFCRRGLPALMRAMLPAALLSGADFAAIAELAFSDGWTLLHLAVMSHSVQMVRALMNLGKEHGYTWRWDIPGPMGLTPLHMLAVDINGAEMLKFVVSVEPDVSAMWFKLSISNETLHGTDGLFAFLYVACCMYVLLMIELGNFKQPTRVVWSQEGMLPYALALLPLGLPLVINWVFQSFTWYYKWRETIHVAGSYASVAVSLCFGIGPMQWFLSRWSNSLFAVGFVASRVSFPTQVRLCHQVRLHAAELFVALVSALRHGMLHRAFAECFCMILAMGANLAWTYYEEKQSRLNFLNSKPQRKCAKKLHSKLA
eukprot:evm.model.scf_395.4 EVM.evm.TU.scf_395.4   scf_395:33192-46020(-)